MKQNILISISLVLLMMIFIVSGYQIIRIFKEYKIGEDTYARLEKYVKLYEQNLNLSEQGEINDPIVNFDELKDINEDIVGWIYCDGTVINYPVVKTNDNIFYLNHLFDKSINSSGCIFLDSRNKSEFLDQHNIIYGHHMKNNTMFSSLVEYKSQEYYDEHPQMLLLTPEKNYKIEIFAGYVSNIEDNAWNLKFSSDEEFEKWIEQTIKKSCFNSDIVPVRTDRIITMSTCSYEFDNARFVVLGVLKSLSPEERIIVK